VPRRNQVQSYLLSWTEYLRGFSGLTFSLNQKSLCQWNSPKTAKIGIKEVFIATEELTHQLPDILRRPPDLGEAQASLDTL